MELNIPKTGRDDRLKPSVKDCLDFINRNNLSKSEQDEKNRWIQDLFERGFIVSNPTGTRKIESKTLYQAVWRTVAGTKPLSWTLHGNRKNPKLPVAPEMMPESPVSEEEVEKMMTDAVYMMMDEGGYTNALMGKDGAIWKMYLYGNGFVMFGKNPDENSSIPLVYTSISNNNIWVDNYCTGIRGVGSGKNATQACVIFGYRWDEACRIWPKIKKYGEKGRIPRTEYDKDQDKNYLQDYDIPDDELVEVAFYYDVAKKVYAVFAGRTCTLIDEKKGDNYEWMYKKTPYIPILDFRCMPSSEGFYDHGIGDAIFQIALVYSRLLNMEVNHIEDNVDPLTLINVPKGEAALFFKKLAAAREEKRRGYKPFVAMEYGPGTPAGNVSAQSLLTQNLFNEWAAVCDRLDRELRRLGINLDESDYANFPNQEAVFADEQNRTLFIRQAMENNVNSTKFAVLLTLELAKSIPKSDNTPIQSTTALIRTTPSGVREVAVGKSLTLGMASQTLKEWDFFVRVDAASGAIRSNLAEITNTNNLLNVTPPGTIASNKLLMERAKLADKNFSIEDFQAPAAPMAPTNTSPIPPA